MSENENKISIILVTIISVLILTHFSIGVSMLVKRKDIDNKSEEGYDVIYPYKNSAIKQKKLTDKELKIMGIVLISITSFCFIGLIIVCIMIYNFYGNFEKIPIYIKVLISVLILYTLVGLICGGILLDENIRKKMTTTDLTTMGSILTTISSIPILIFIIIVGIIGGETNDNN